MEISPFLQFLHLWYSFLFGVGLGILRDAFRILRFLLGHVPTARVAPWYEKKLPILGRALGLPGRGKKVLLGLFTFLLDLLFFLVAGCGIAILQYALNSGQFRALSVVAALLGFLLYVMTVGRLVAAASAAVVFLLRAATAIALFLLMQPFLVLGRAFLGIFRKIRKKIKEALAKRARIRYNKCKREELRRWAQDGFLP